MLRHPEFSPAVRLRFQLQDLRLLAMPESRGLLFILFLDFSSNEARAWFRRWGKKCWMKNRRHLTWIFQLHVSGIDFPNGKIGHARKRPRSRAMHSARSGFRTVLRTRSVVLRVHSVEKKKCIKPSNASRFLFIYFISIFFLIFLSMLRDLFRISKYWLESGFLFAVRLKRQRACDSVQKDGVLTFVGVLFICFLLPRPLRF